MLQEFGAALAALLARAEPLSDAWFSGPVAPASAGTLIGLGRPILPLFAIPLLAALLVILGQRAFVISFEKLQPRLDRISPLAGAKNKFGRNGLFEFAKSAVKLIVISVVLALYLMGSLPEMLATMALGANQVAAITFRAAVEFLILAFVLMLVLGAIDFLWQRAEHLRKHRMSHKELMDEMKQNEGDPYLKGRRREKGIEIATNRMIADVPKADVVIVNPTHYAVALRWDRTSGSAPTCIAKGVDEVALRIRAKAIDAGVPIRSDPPTARALHASVDLGAQVRPEHYRAVAVAIRFADRVRQKARGG